MEVSTGPSTAANQSQKEIQAMRESVERFLDGGNSLKSGINAVHNLTAAIWVKASEVGFIEAKSVANDSYNKIGGCGVDRIADHTVDLGNGRTLEANGLQYYTGSSLGGDSGSITITNLRGNKIEIKLRDGAHCNFKKGHPVEIDMPNVPRW